MLSCLRRCSSLFVKNGSKYDFWNVSRCALSRFHSGSIVSTALRKDSIPVTGSDSWSLLRSTINLNSDSNTGSPYILTKEQEDYITNGDPAVKLKLDTLLMELFVSRQRGETLPEIVRLDELVSLLDSSYSRRLKILRRIYIQSMVKNKDEKEKKAKREYLEVLRKERDDYSNSLEHPWLQYRLFGNAIFPRLYVRTINHFYNYRLEQGRQFGQNIVFDCSYNQQMRDLDIKNAAKQLVLSLQAVKEDRNPFCITFCNIEEDDRMFYYLKKNHPMIDVEVPITFTKSNYTDLFPRENIVYLSPHCRYDLEYSPDDVYIIGALVDKVDPTAHSIAKAREDGVRVARFPIDRYINWQQGSKSLCINQVVGIMVNLKNSGSWEKAFAENLPVRKFTKYESTYARKSKNRSLFLHNPLFHKL